MTTFDEYKNVRS